MASRSFLLFVFGLCATVFLTEVGKISSGVLRPNFMDLCRPNVTCRGRDAGKRAHGNVAALKNEKLNIRFSIHIG